VLHFEGDRDLAQPPAELYAKLSDVRFLVQCIPGVESAKSEAPDQAVCVVKPAGLSFASGNLELTIRRTEATPDSAAKMVIASKGIGSTSEVVTAFTLTAQEGGTKLHWTADIQKLGGLLKAVPQGLIKAAAQKIIADLWEQAAARLGAPGQP
jgi:carbon monoxide dehydrogenase subunit G